MVKKSGIYKIYFTNDYKYFYIGSAINISERITRHRYELKKQIHKNKILQRVYNKYGDDKMAFSILELTTNSDNLIQKEQYFIDLLNPTMNILRTAGSCLGYKHLSSTKKHLSKINLGKKMTTEQNFKNSIAQKNNKNALGAIRSESFKLNLSKIKQRKVINTETGEIYPSIGIASEKIGLKYPTLYAKLSGKNINNTKLSFI
jgi:group I intron endonuclease